MFLAEVDYICSCHMSITSVWNTILKDEVILISFPVNVVLCLSEQVSVNVTFKGASKFQFY